MTLYVQRIVEELRAHPEGMTPADLAEKLGCTKAQISSRLSKLSAYGDVIQRKPIRDGKSRPSVYQVRQPGESQ